ncbi:MAG: right-handed parallel beta-helix repeat-containing protein, partial [Thermoplasmata archaeon]|nr:right-handed parallel beta-helix repeat-containing protein [Thermoplasmata archaeon]
ENNTATDNARGIYLVDSHNNTISSNMAADNWDYGIYVVSSTNINIKSNNVSNSDRGMFIVRSNSSSIANNTVSNNGYGIRIWRTANTTVERNNIFGNWEPGILTEVSTGVFVRRNNVSSNYVGIRSTSCDGATITENNVSSSYWYGVHLHASTNNILTHNVMVQDGIFISGNSLRYWNTHTIETSNTVNGKPVHYWKNATGGTVPLNAGEVILANSTSVVIEQQNISNSSVGILLGFSSGNAIANNTVSSNTEGGIYLHYSDGNAIVNNSALPDNDCGIYLGSSNNNTVTNNTASNNREYGIFLSHSSRNLVSRNIARLNDVIGIRLYYSENNTIEGNNLSSNGHALSLYYSNNNTIARNSVSWNDQSGIRVGSSHNNTIYHNNMVNNTQQASDDTEANQWDDGYPSGGNYWSNYTGVDNCSGPNQDVCPDPDGIGDEPYVIDADSRDRYPLMSPFGIFPPRPPEMLGADLSGSELENITLTWSLSPDDGAGRNNVVRYDIFRGSNYDPSGLGYLLHWSVPAGNPSYVDVKAGEGNSSNYFYVVCAVSDSDLSSCSPNQAGKFTRPLSRGAYLISIPLVQSNKSIEKVLQTVKFDKVWSYDSSSGEWESYMSFKPYKGALKTTNNTMGVWVNVTAVSNLTVAGTVPSQTMIRLDAGWNLIAFPSFNSTYAVSDLNTSVNSTRVEGFDPSASPHYLRILVETDVLQAGYGYWVWVEEDIVWTVYP